MAARGDLGEQATGRRSADAERHVPERLAWGIARTSSRSFFLAIALVAVVLVAGAGVFAAWVATRNAEDVTDARDRGLQVAVAVTAFEDHFNAADLEVATVLVTAVDDPPPTFGDAEATPARTRYEQELRAAGRALTDAGVAADAADADAVAEAAEGLARYADLIETSRSYPPGSTFGRLARDLARDDLGPAAGAARTAAEQRIARATDRVAGPRTSLAVAASAGSLVVILAGGVLLAGRTRRVAHPALAVAAGIAVLNIVVVGAGLRAQSRQLDAASDGEIAAYTTATATTAALFDLRVDELDALVAPHGGDASFARFTGGLDRLPSGPGVGDDALDEAVAAYRAAVRAVDDDLAAGRHDLAADAVLSGESAAAHREARGLAINTVNRTAEDLLIRLDAAADRSVAPLLPAGLGILAAGAAATGVLARGRPYR